MCTVLGAKDTAVDKSMPLLSSDNREAKISDGIKCHKENERK